MCPRWLRGPVRRGRRVTGELSRLGAWGITEGGGRMVTFGQTACAGYFRNAAVKGSRGMGWEVEGSEIQGG